MGETGSKRLPRNGARRDDGPDRGENPIYLADELGIVSKGGFSNGVAFRVEVTSRLPVGRAHSAALRTMVARKIKQIKKETVPAETREPVPKKVPVRFDL